MTPVLFNYPDHTVFGKILHKQTIYDQAKPPKRIRDLFISDIESIRWAHKLAPTTLQLEETPEVPEIQVFHVTLRHNRVNLELFRCIDKAIHFPIIYELTADNQVKSIMAHKRPHEQDQTRWVVENYFETPWMPKETPRKPLPVALDLGVLYTELLRSHMPIKRQGESLAQQMERLGKLNTMLSDREKLKTRIKKEKQFNRKVDFNSQLKRLDQEIKKLES